MPLGQCEAAKKFWETPELVEKLLPFLDLGAILHLAKTNKMTRDILQKSCIWNQLVRRSCPMRLEHFSEENGFLRKEELQPGFDRVRGLVAILKLLKDPMTLLLDLLDVICERFAQNETQDRFFFPLFTVGCPCHSGSHSVSLPGFLLLEEAEGAFGTAVQHLVAIDLGFLGGEYGSIGELSLLAVSSRMVRQEHITTIDLIRIEITSRESAKAFHDLLQTRPRFRTFLKEVEVFGLIGVEGWEFLARAFQFEDKLVWGLTTSKMILGEGRRVDIKEIWDATGHEGFYIELCCYSRTTYQHVLKKDQWGNDCWDKVEQILDMTEEEWVAQVEKAAGGLEYGAGEDEAGEEEAGEDGAGEEEAGEDEAGEEEAGEDEAGEEEAGEDGAGENFEENGGEDGDADGEEGAGKES